MSIRSRVSYRRAMGLTAVELAVAISILVILVVALIPVIGTARGHASQQAAASEMSTIYLALMSYAGDNAGYTPVNIAVNGGDFASPVMGKWPAGKDVWGIPPKYHGSSSPVTAADGTPPTNEALGYGTLVSDGYMNLDLLWVPAERVPGNYYYDRSIYFGAAYQQPWSDPANGNPGPWSPWWGGGNYWLSGSYTFRSNDWSTFTYDANKLPMIGSGGNYNEGAFRNTNLAHTRPTTAGYTTKATMVENQGTYHFPNLGANVLVGDGSIVFWESPEHAALAYTRNYVSFYPRNPASGDKFHAGFRSMLMDAADKFR